MIGGLVRPSAGDLRIAGRPLWQDGRRDRTALAELGMVFQDANLFPWLTIEDNIALPLRLRGVGKRERRARADGLVPPGRHRGLREAAAARAVGRHAPARRDRPRAEL